MAENYILDFTCTNEKCEGEPNTPAQYIGGDVNLCSDCYWNELDIEVVAPPMEVAHLKIKPTTYIIQVVWKDEEKEVCSIHRQMSEDEVRDTDETFTYKGKIYLHNVAKVHSKENALTAIHSWWRGCISLNDLNKKEKGKYEYIK